MLYHGYNGRNVTGVKGDIMNPITMKMIQPLAFKGYEDEDFEADVAPEENKLERQPEKDEVVKEEKAPEKVAAKKPAAVSEEKKAEKPEETIQEKMNNLNKNADAVANGVNDVANSAAKTIVGVTGGAAVVGGAAGPAMDNMKKAAKAFQPMADGIKNMAQKFKSGTKAAGEAGEQGTKAAIVAMPSISLKPLIKRIRSIF
jgi:DNA-binding ferritin-like protein